MANLNPRSAPTAIPLFHPDLKMAMRHVALGFQKAVNSNWHFAVFLLANVLTGFGFMLFRASGSPQSWGLVPADSTWTTLVYARNFADTLTFSYNPGDAATGMTSPLWVILLGTTSRLFSVMGMGLPQLAQLGGMLMAFAASSFGYLLVRDLTGLKWFGVLAGLLIALEPTFGFSKVAGSEVAMFSALVMGFAWALMTRRMTVASLLLALAVLARPEGILLAALGLMALVSKLLWEKGEGESLNSDEIQDLALFLAPTALALIAWGGYNQVTTGRLLPSAFYVMFQQPQLLDAANLGAVWNGYLKETSFFNGFQVAISVSIMVTGVYYLIRHGGVHGAPLVFFPPALIYVVSILVPFPQAQWTYESRQHLDAILPILLVLLVLGVAWVWDASVAYIEGQERLDSQMRGHLQFTLALAVVFLLGVPLAGAPYLWSQLMPEYSRNVRNVAEVTIPMAQWLNTEVRPEARIATLSPGAMRYFSGRDLTDATGLNNAEAIGEPVFEYVPASGADYVVAYDNLYIRSWPGYEEVASVATQDNSILEGSRLVTYRVGSSAQEADKNQVQAFIPSGLTLIDSLDVGDIDDEAAHSWEAEPLTDTQRRTYRAGPDAVVADDAHVTSGYESFRVRSVPGKDLTIVKRYDAAVRGAVRVIANGQVVGLWRFPPRRYFFGEDQFVVPGRFIGGGTTLLRFENIPGDGDAAVNNIASYYYWLYVPNGGASDTP